VDCTPSLWAIFVSAVKNDPWQIRARRAGLSQAKLAKLAGRTETAVSEGLTGKKNGGVPPYLQNLIRLWEIADREGREAILAEPYLGFDARERLKAPKPDQP
jgi:predicted transcriptional regulator